MGSEKLNPLSFDSTVTRFDIEGYPVEINL